MAQRPVHPRRALSWRIAFAAAGALAAGIAAPGADKEPPMPATKAARTGTTPQAKILATKVLCKQPGRYIGWPTITRRSDGELVAVFSGDRDAHVCPFGKTQMIRSRDGGTTWSKPVTINNTPLDDRDAGVIETRAGTLLVSWFTSLAFEQTMQPAWRRHAEKIGAATKRRWLGSWVRRSTDGGKTWSEPIRVAGSAPHGPIELRDGRLLYLGTGEIDGKEVVAAEASRDDGKTWKVVATMPTTRPRKRWRLCEPHVVEAAPGRIVAMFRVEPVRPGVAVEQFLYQADSSDGGKTWTAPRKTAVWGYPPHLIRLANGWLLVSFGRRKPPYGQRACISRDGGKTWDVAGEITLAKARNADLGYPATCQLKDGSLLTVFYQIDKAREKTCLMATHWRLAPGP